VCPNCRVELELNAGWTFSLCPNCGRRYSPEEVQAIARGELVPFFTALYIDGYEDVWSGEATISLGEKEIAILVGQTGNQTAFKVAYDRIESLNVLQEREITALRTFLIGPTFAAWFKKKTRTLTIGFRDQLGLMQIPSFKMANSDISSCYKRILEQVEKSRRGR
jgi:hypothetical protein